MQNTIVLAKEKREVGFVLDPEFELLVGTAGIHAFVLGLSTVAPVRDIVATIAQNVVCLHLVGSPSVASAVAASMDSDNGRSKDGEEGRELHVEVGLRRILGVDMVMRCVCESSCAVLVLMGFLALLYVAQPSTHRVRKAPFSL
jgi:hypothetical protein